MQGFLLSIRVVTPILLMLCVGMLVRRLGWVDEKTLNVMDRLGFKLLLPTQLFYSLYRAEWDVSVYGKPLLASIVIILIILALALLIFGRLEPDPKRRGPVIQCEIRVNFVIFGMAIIASLYGSENTGLIAIMAAIIIPLTSTISAILFEVYRGGRVKPAMLLLNIIKNPYLIGAALGLIFLLLRIPLPQPVEKRSAISAAWPPLIALLCWAAASTFPASAITAVLCGWRCWVKASSSHLCSFHWWCWLASAGMPWRHWQLCWPAPRRSPVIPWPTSAAPMASWRRSSLWSPHSFQSSPCSSPSGFLPPWR